MADETAVAIVPPGGNDGGIVPAQNIGVVAAVGLVAGDAGDIVMTLVPHRAPPRNHDRAGRSRNFIAGHGSVDVVGGETGIFSLVGNRQVDRMAEEGRIVEIPSVAASRVKIGMAAQAEIVDARARRQNITGVIINDYFKYRLQRPEILNRIGENIVVFDYIRLDVADGIFDKMLDNVKDNLKRNHKISVEIEEKALNELQAICLSSLEMGGRGIGNQLENVFVNPLSRVLFQLNARSGDTIIVLDVLQKGTRWEIEAIKKSI